MVKSISEVRKIVNEYKDELKRHNIHTAKVILYGSYAKGRPNPYSDIDLIVVSPDLAKFSPLKRQKLLAQLTMGIDAPLEVIGYTPKEFKKADTTIFGQTIHKTGKLLKSA
jgi:predicted nucleotidyltransferase